MKQHYILDLFLFLTAAVCIGTGIILDFHLLARGMKGTLRTWHLYSGYLMAGGILLHLVWHWNWIRAGKKILVKKSK